MMARLIHDGTIHGGQIQCAREVQRLTRRELAAKLGMTTHDLAMWERGGRQRPYGDLLPRLCFALGFRPDFFRLTPEPRWETTLDWHCALQRREQARWLHVLRRHHLVRRRGLDAATVRGLCSLALPSARAGWSTWGRVAGCCGHVHTTLAATAPCCRGTDRIAVRVRPSHPPKEQP